MIRPRHRLAAVLAAIVLVLAIAVPTSVHALGASQTVEQKVLEWLFKQTAFGSAPTQLWFGLASADPGDTCANELPSTGSYARAQLNPDTNNSTNTNYNAIDQAGAQSIISNKLAVTFPTATAQWNSGTAIAYFFIKDASTSGTCLWSGQIAGGAGVTVNNGTTVSLIGGSPGVVAVRID